MRYFVLTFVVLLAGCGQGRLPEEVPASQKNAAGVTTTPGTRLRQMGGVFETDRSIVRVMCDTVENEMLYLVEARGGNTSNVPSPVAITRGARPCKE